MSRIRLGVVGTGAVSRMYLPILARMDAVEVSAVADVDRGAAQARADEHGIATVYHPDDLIADPGIDLVVNLTPIPVHAQISTAALAAGKHVYSEKPLATTTADAVALVQQAEAAGRTLACAPDTLLGTGFQAARQAMDDGAIGRPLAANAFMFRSALDPASPYAQGANPFLDMAPYYVSALINLFGPVRRVSGATTSTDDDRPDGTPIALSGVLEFVNGLMADLLVAWGTDHRHEVPNLTVYGTEGVLQMPNPNNFGDPAYVRRHDQNERTEVPGSRQDADWPANLRGLGVGQQALAIGAHTEPLASGRIAAHVVDVITGIVAAARTGERVTLTTRADPAPPMPASTRTDLIGGTR